MHKILYPTAVQNLKGDPQVALFFSDIIQESEVRQRWQIS